MTADVMPAHAIRQQRILMELEDRRSELDAEEVAWWAAAHESGAAARMSREEFSALADPVTSRFLIEAPDEEVVSAANEILAVGAELLRDTSLLADMGPPPPHVLAMLARFETNCLSRTERVDLAGLSHSEELSNIAIELCRLRTHLLEATSVRVNGDAAVSSSGRSGGELLPCRV